MTKIPKTVAKAIPPKTAVPSATRLAAPAPVAKSSGMHPRMNEKRGHQDRSESQPARPAWPPRTALLPSWRNWLAELDDQDRVLGRQSDQQHESDLGVDVVVETAGQGQDRSAENGDRHREDHAKGQGPALVLCSEEEIDEDDGQSEDEAGRAACGELLIGHPGPGEAHGWRHGVPAISSMVAMDWPEL